MHVAAEPRAHPEPALERHQHLVAAVLVRRGDLPRAELERGDGQVLGADHDPAQHAEVAPPQHVAHQAQARRRRLGRRPPAEPRVVGIAGRLEVRLRTRVRARRAGGGRWCEELEHAQRLRPEREGVMPRVAPEEDALPGCRALHLAGLGVGDHEHALEHVQQLVGGEDRAEVLRVPEPRAGREPEDEHVDLVGRRVDPVEDLAGGRVAPDVARDVGAADQRRPVERRPGRRGRRRRPLGQAHTALRGSWTRTCEPTEPSRVRSGSGKSLAISRARPSVPAACAASMISSAW